MSANASSDVSRYRGRFAPSPTGPLHFGSLVAAAGSYLQARSSSGDWLVRMEDLDTPRNAPGAADGILRDLERFALRWDEAVVYQSHRLDVYADALDRLRREALVYDCGCSRRDLEDGVYPGTCRAGVAEGRRARSVRVLTCDQPVSLEDRVQGNLAQNLQSTCGDFVLHRADGIFAYHLAVTVDDALQCMSEIVRGADLLDSTPRQIHLQRCLRLPTPAYAHLPVAVNGDGQKLSKQTFARPVRERDPGEVLFEVLEFLGQSPAPVLRGAAPDEVLAWGVAHWRLDAVPRRGTIRYRQGASG
ncbi:MAG TPA: tRNA glutamyl-Q(34) synthetase GluQRS [Gammaproteobacteria bacterium]|nr:tRNA glutamyl-Q(34) synthetase GluQRS [Gammaproteobacteria bacterium]